MLELRTRFAELDSRCALLSVQVCYGYHLQDELSCLEDDYALLVYT